MRHSRSNTAQRLMCGAAAIAILSCAGMAHAEEQRAFTIEPQSLSTALAEFGAQSGHPVMAPMDLLGSKTTRGFSDSAEPTIALAQLLDGTGLTFTRSGDTFAIVRASDPQSGSAAGDGAEGTVQALVVTAQKREENIQDVPIAMSAFSQEDLTRSQVAGGPDLMTQVPNFTFTKTNFSGYSIQIRGIGTQAISATTDPAVAVAFNNTPFVRNRFFEQEFYDLERVEVLRGPQGTLYGRNATAGVVNLISAKPKHEFEARLSADVSNYSSHRLEGMINLPLVEDKAALRIAGAWTKRDGYVKNTITGEQTDGRDLWSTRVTLGLTPTDNLSVNLIWEHFNEDDNRLRSGKQLCHRDSTEETNITQTQGCIPASLYSPDSFETPASLALPYYGPLGSQGAPSNPNIDAYLSHDQSRNLREIETRIKPEYTAKTDTLELQLKLDLPHNLTLASETGFLRDFIFSFEDYNRFNTSPHAFIPGTGRALLGMPFYDVVGLDGIYCDPQLGCSDRLMAADLDTARSRQFSQEFRLSSDFEGPFNFNVGANFLRYDTEEKYYVFINNITGMYATDRDVRGAIGEMPPATWVPGVSDNSECVVQNFYGFAISNPDRFYEAIGCGYIDPNDIHHLNDNGRNYFLSKNPYHLISYAAFGEAYYNITPELKLTAGLRWTVDQKTAPQIPSWLVAAEVRRPGYARNSTYGLPVRKVIEQEWREPTGRIALDWKPAVTFTDDTLVYASYVRGYKAGGANPPPPIPVTGTICPPECTGEEGLGPDFISHIISHFITHPETFKPEFVDAYEVGTKNTLLDGRLTANLSAFYYDYKDYQISEIVDRSALNLNFDAKVWGGELELDWRPLENLRLGFKGGYEDTRVAKGMKAVDLMDRTAGQPGWVVHRPFPSLPSHCVFPTWLLAETNTAGCEDYMAGVDPVTWLPYVPNPTAVAVPGLNIIPPGYPGFDTTNPANANYGEGFYKDLSGHQLPNAPKFTATITADYTLPLPNNWLVTLHTDLYRQSEAWTRIFNTPGYDKLKAYNNVNLAAIFSNEDQGWQVMAYVKNVLNKDNITGAFLNSDDTGLTTNVFLNEPRLYGIRVTKNWAGGAGPFGGPHTPGAPYPFTVEFGGQMMRTSAPGEGVMPFADAFSAALDPRQPQREHLDWTHSPEVRFTYQPSGSPWKLAAGFRYGRTINETPQRRFEEVAGPDACAFPLAEFTGIYEQVAKAFCTHDALSPVTGTNKYGAGNYVAHPKNRVGVQADRNESHVVADFEVGKDVGLGLLGIRSSLGTGLRFADFKALVTTQMDGVPDNHVPEGWQFADKYPTTLHHYAADLKARQEFKGAGPTLSWDASRNLFGADDAGHLDVDWTLTGGVLFGKQKVAINGTEGSADLSGPYWRPYGPLGYAGSSWSDLPINTQPLHVDRDKSVAVPLVDFSLGLSYQIPGVKLGAGYRWERYFNVLDAGGLSEHKSFDRTLDGPYIKFAVGFGG